MTIYRLCLLYRTGDRLCHINLIIAMEPAICPHIDRFHKGLAPQTGEVLLIAVIDNDPLAVRGVDDRTVSLAPPALFFAPRVDKRIVGGVNPRTVDALRTGLHHHMAGWWSCRSTLGIEVIIVPAYLA